MAAHLTILFIMISFAVAAARNSWTEDAMTPVNEGTWFPTSFVSGQLNLAALMRFQFRVLDRETTWSADSYDWTYASLVERGGSRPRGTAVLKDTRRYPAAKFAILARCSRDYGAFTAIVVVV
jgi:hypothetical protein